MAEITPDDPRYYIRDPKTGLSPAQVEANKAVAEAAATSGRTVTTGKTGTTNRVVVSAADRAAATIKARQDKFAAELAAREASKPTEDPGQGNIWSYNVAEGRWKKVNVAGGFGGNTNVSGNNNTGFVGNTGSGNIFTASDGTVFTDQNAYVAYENNLRNKNLETQSATAAATAERQSAYNLLYQQFAQYGLQSLVAPLESLIKEGIPASEFVIRLRETDAYKKRFAANAQRIKAGLRALSEAEYIQLEDQYQNVMRNYGLPASYYERGEMGVQPGFEKFIAGDVSAAELEDRIQTAQNRVINAAPEVSRALKEFYPDITNGDILAYALDPNQALTNIKRKVGAAEIGAGAMQAGLATGLSRAEELQKYGVTGEAARAGYQAIGSYLPRATQLSDIYAKSGLGPYSQTTAEQEVFGIPGSVEAANKRRKLSELEQAQFGGTSGITTGALARERAGQF